MPDCASFADTMAEPASVYRWLDWLEPQLPFPVHRVSAGSLEKQTLDLITKKDGIRNNILDGEQVRDISKRYKTVTVTGQQQGYDSLTIDDINVTGTAVDDTFPFAKLFKAKIDLDGKNPDAYARVLLEKQQFEGYQLRYTVDGHSQRNKNYQVN